MNMYQNQRALMDPSSGIIMSPREWIRGWAEDDHVDSSLHEFLSELQEVKYDGSDWMPSYVESNLGHVLGMGR